MGVPSLNDIAVDGTLNTKQTKQTNFKMLKTYTWHTYVHVVVFVVVSLYFLRKYEYFQQNVYHIKIMNGTKIRVRRKTNKNI